MSVLTVEGDDVSNIGLYGLGVEDLTGIRRLVSPHRDDYSFSRDNRSAGGKL